MWKEFKAGDRFLMFQARFKFGRGKLKSNWYGPFTVTKAYSFVMVELVDEATGEEFKISSSSTKMNHQSLLEARRITDLHGPATMRFPNLENLTSLTDLC